MLPRTSLPAHLVLEDGRTFKGYRFGAYTDVIGEVVFNTAMTGYQEILGDPSYSGQIVLMTYPMIGNYGVAPDDFESQKIYLSGLIVKEPSGIASNWRHHKTLEDYLGDHSIPGLFGIDTRALVRHLRDKGSMRGTIIEPDEPTDTIPGKLEAYPCMAGRDLVATVSTQSPYTWDTMPVHLGGAAPASPEPKFDVVVYDFGVKRNILRALVGMGCNVTVVPANTPASDVLARNPDGVVLSNGPGDPEPVTYAIENVRQLLGKTPIFGICLGHQILGLACGAKTYKLKFGHHGANHPVQRLSTKAIEVTSQNHGFAIDADTLPQSLELTHINLNDNTVSGIRAKEVPAFSVQYHPEAAPGPHDSRYLFEEFRASMSAWKENGQR